MNEREKLEAAAKAAGIQPQSDWNPEYSFEDSQQLARLCGITISTASATSGAKLVTAVAPDGTEAFCRDYNIHSGMLQAVFKCAVLLGEKLP